MTSPELSSTLKWTYKICISHDRTLPICISRKLTYWHSEEVALHFFRMNHSHVLDRKRDLQCNEPTACKLTMQVITIVSLIFLSNAFSVHLLKSLSSDSLMYRSMVFRFSSHVISNFSVSTIVAFLYSSPGYVSLTGIPQTWGGC